MHGRLLSSGANGSEPFAPSPLCSIVHRTRAIYQKNTIESECVEPRSGETTRNLGITLSEPALAGGTVGGSKLTFSKNKTDVSTFGRLPHKLQFVGLIDVSEANGIREPRLRGDSSVARRVSVGFRV